MNERMPEPEASGFVKTLNNMGYMTSSLDPYSRAFVAFSPKAPGPALDIGAAYGIATIASLKAGACVIANDLDSRHLEILSDRVPKSLRARLTLKAGAFPDEIKFRAASLGAVLVCRVMHFFDGKTAERAAKKIHGWLAPKGKVFVATETPFLRNFQKFIPIYEERVRQGDPWPGLVEDVLAYSPVRGKSLPKSMLFFDEATLTRVFLNAGFEIERAGLFPRKDFPADIQLDGRESVGLIARKI